MKYLVLLVTLFYLVYKVTTFLFRAGAAAQQNRQQRFDRSTDTDSKKGKKSGTIKGGDYIDYEEVK